MFCTKHFEKQITEKELLKKESLVVYKNHLDNLETYINNIIGKDLFKGSYVKYYFERSYYKMSENFGQLKIYFKNDKYKWSEVGTMEISFEKKTEFLNEKISLSNSSSDGRVDRDSVRYKANAINLMLKMVDYLEEDIINFKQLMHLVSATKNEMEEIGYDLSSILKEKENLIISEKEWKIKKVLKSPTTEIVNSLMDEIKEKMKTETYLLTNFLYYKREGDKVNMELFRIEASSHNKLSFMLNDRRISQKALKKELLNTIMISNKMIKDFSDLPFEVEIKGGKDKYAVKSIDEIIVRLKKYINIINF